MKTKVTYIISHIDKSLAFEWIASYLNLEKIELKFILLNSKESYLETFLQERGIVVDRVKYLNKFDMITAFIKIRNILKRNNVDIVHTHLFDACLIGLAAAKSLGIERRIHTRHNSTFHHQYFPNAVKYDKLINYLSTDIIAISKVVQKILIEMEGVKESKIRLINHGFDFSAIPDKDAIRVTNLRIKYNIENEYPIIGVISRYIHWKGIQYIIPAYQDILKKYANAKLILANTDGPYGNKIRKLLSNLPKDSYLEIKFEPDVFALYKLFDIFIHTPIDSQSEAFGQVYIESLACEIPSLFTISGIAQEFIKDQQNALRVDFKNSLEIEKAIKKILSDSNLRQNLISNGKKDVLSKFNIHKMISGLEGIYLSHTI